MRTPSASRSSLSTSSSVATPLRATTEPPSSTTKTNGPTTLYYASVCSPCGGGNPGSYEDARAAVEAARAERTELVRVPKSSRVVVKECATDCGTCPSNVP